MLFLADNNFRDHVEGVVVGVDAEQAEDPDDPEHPDCLLYTSGERVFVQAKYRFAYYFCEQLKEYLEDPRKRTHRGLIRKYFKSDEDVRDIRDHELTGSERNGRLFCRLMSGDMPMSKEMLLLTALIVKKQGCREMTRDYVYNHILRNCRFDVALNEDRAFDRFFLNSFACIDRLCDNAAVLEKDLLEMGRGAVFYNVIRGKEV